jgi:hypothetical protein
MKKLFNQGLFEQAVNLYVLHGCRITTSPNEVTSMRVIYEDLKHWANKHGMPNHTDGSTIQQFGSALRLFEHQFGKQLVRGRSGKGKRWVECYLVPEWT